VTRFELVASVIVIFFVVGIALGVLVITAIPGGRRHNGRGYADGGDWPEPPRSTDYQRKPPRWPGR